MKTFQDLGLSNELLEAVNDLGFEKPTPIQERAIPFSLEENSDLIAVAQTGTGKTAAFGIPILQKISPDSNYVQSIILCPTRELCIQIARDMKSYAKHMKKIKVTAVYGGANIGPQIKSIKKGAQIIVGTPGRTLDLIKRKKLDLSRITYSVLDEADEMMSMGFKQDLDKILSKAPKERVSLLYSATMPKGIKDLALKHMKNAKHISVAGENRSTKNVSHAYYLIPPRDRYKALKRIVDVHPDIYGIIFCRTRRETKQVAEWLSRDGYTSDAIHGDLSQAQRDVVMNKFRNKSIRLMVATDVASRGIDVDELTHIINYSLPDEIDVYVHRAGRTGRGKHQGESLILMSKGEMRRLKHIERKIGKKVEQRKIPHPNQIKEKQIFNLIHDIEHAVPAENEYIDKIMDEILGKLSWMTKEELLRRLVSIEFEKMIEYYKDHEDLNEKAEKSSRSKGSRRNSRKDKGRGRKKRNKKSNKKNVNFSQFAINIGRKQNVSPQDVIKMINSNMPRKDIEIGDIQIHKSHTTFEIDKKYSSTVPKSFNNAKYNGRGLLIQEI